MKNTNFKIIINVALAVWIFIWAYYLAFNWSVFSVELKTNLGFAVITSHPFLFFSLLGLVILIVLKYAHHVLGIQQNNLVKDSEHKIKLMEKDIEILKIKEVLFKMQTKEMNDSSSALVSLMDKLDKLSDQFPDNKTTGDPSVPDGKNEQDKNKGKQNEIEKDANKEK